MLKARAHLLLLLGILTAGSAWANRYQPEIDLVQQHHREFVLQADRHFKWIELYRASWQMIGDEMRRFGQIVAARPPLGQVQDRYDAQVQQLAAQKVYFESVASELKLTQATVARLFVEAGPIVAELPEVRDRHEEMRETIRRRLAEFDRLLQDRRAQVDQRFQNWLGTQRAAALQAMAADKARFLDALKVGEQIEQSAALLQYLHDKANLAIRLKRATEAKEILAGLVWLRSTLPVLLADRIVNPAQLQLLRAYLEDSRKKEDGLRARIASGEAGQSKIESPPERMFAGIVDFVLTHLPEAIAQKTGGGGSKGGQAPDASQEWNDIKSKAGKMKPGSSGEFGGSRSQTMADGSKVEIEWNGNFHKSACKYDTKTSEGKARVDVMGKIGLKSTESTDPKESVPMPRDGTLDRQIRDSISERFQRSFEVACKCETKDKSSSNRSSSASGSRGNGPQGSRGSSAPQNQGGTPPASSGGGNAPASGAPETVADARTPGRAAELIDHEIGKSDSPSNTQDLQGLRGAIAAWQQAESAFHALLNDSAVKVATAMKDVQDALEAMATSNDVAPISDPAPLLTGGSARYADSVDAIEDHLQRVGLMRELGQVVDDAAINAEGKELAGAEQVAQAMDEMQDLPGKPGYQSPRARHNQALRNRVSQRVAKARAAGRMEPKEMNRALTDLSRVAQRSKISEAELRPGAVPAGSAQRQKEIQELAGTLVEIGSLGAGLTPVGPILDLHDLVTGRDFFTGEAISPAGRVIVAGGLLLGMGAVRRGAKKSIEPVVKKLEPVLEALSRDAREAAEKALREANQELIDKWNNVVDPLVERFNHLRQAPNYGRITEAELKELKSIEDGLGGSAKVTDAYYPNVTNNEDLANRTLRAGQNGKSTYNFHPPAKAGARVLDLVLTKPADVWRVWGGASSNKLKNWVVAFDPRTMTPKELRSALNLPPTSQIEKATKFTLPAGTRLRGSIVEGASTHSTLPEMNGVGGAIQYEILELDSILDEIVEGITESL